MMMMRMTVTMTMMAMTASDNEDEDKVGTELLTLTVLHVIQLKMTPPAQMSANS